ncbi:hypothetical protein HHL22_20260 [Hymenobacter sp. RP-2-7]|uniref:Uncharacterized protein n=1 Tax=Hymenobacter polaris TaxID=2682546 RepID=A0A7Y0FP09_9BACT|nr:hypothetical protein [Hymenobacter polaris]NML67542.1 hypothetical protein [Hymenobacter polaris]
MKRLTTFSTAQWLLLGLAALLVFGSCGGGVSGFLYSLGASRRQRLWHIMSQERRAHEAARRQLRGRARLAVYDSLEARAQRQLDSLAPGAFAQRKLAHRWPKIERQLRRQQAAGQ